MAHVQSTSESSYSAGSTGDLQLTSVVAGNCLLAITRQLNASGNPLTGVSSSIDGAFTKLTALEGTSGKARLEVWYLENASAGTHTITYTTAGTGVTVRWAVAEYDSVPASGIIDDYAEALFTTTTTPSTANVTTTGTNRVIVSAIATDASATSIGSAGGETERQEVDARFQFQDEFAATTGDHAASWTLGATQPGVYIVFALKSGVTLTKYLKLLAESSAASATGVEVAAYSAPSGSNYITGTTRYGSANAKSFEASLESGNAVLKVLASDVGCDGLAAATTIRALAQNTTYTTGMVEATIIEE